MGMYTELCLTVEFRKDTPDVVIDALKYMTGQTEVAVATPHALFGTDRWDWALRSGGSYYFSGQPCLVFKYDDIGKCWFLTVLTNIKNYTQEWEHFLDFIGPHIYHRREPLTFLGWMRYEEDLDPTLLYYDGTRVVFKEVDFASGH